MWITSHLSDCHAAGADESQPAGEYAQKDSEHAAQPMLATGAILEEGQTVSAAEVEHAAHVAQEQQKREHQNAEPSDHPMPE